MSLKTTREASQRIIPLLIISSFYYSWSGNVLGTLKKGKFYFFTDFRKAFDMVHRDKLLFILLQNGNHGIFVYIVYIFMIM